MLLTHTASGYKEVFFEALGIEGGENSLDNPSWPLPNLASSTEQEFWGWRSSYSFTAEAWLGQIQIDGEWATVIIYFAGHSHFIDGGFAVAYFYEYRKERVAYYTWRKCVHKFQQKNIGNCLNRYTCLHCHKSFEVDSSD